MAASLPVPIRTMGLLSWLQLEIYHLMLCGRAAEALTRCERATWIAARIGDELTVAMVMQVRMYALTRLEDYVGALATGDALLAMRRITGLRVDEAKTLADTAEILILMGRVDEGLYRLASAKVILDSARPSHSRYHSALSSVCGAARSAHLFELAEEAAVEAARVFPEDAAALTVQRSELTLDRAMGLDQVGFTEDAERYYTRSVRLAESWLADNPADVDQAPLVNAILAVGLAKTGRHDEAEKLAVDLILPMRAAGYDQEARKAHLAYGIVLRNRGDRAAAAREFAAGEELAETPFQRLTFQVELALLAAGDRADPGARAIRAALNAQARHLWRQRLERRAIMQQARRRVELEIAQAAADRAMIQDALTGLGNRRQFDRQINRIDESYVLVLIDVDHFKTINDSYSHQTGDRILCEVAATLRAHCRVGDTAVRLGGDEFALFLRTDPAGAAQVANRIREVLAARDWNAFGLGLRVTLSIGVAQCLRGMDGSTLYDRADQQLYAAKRAGRDRISVSSNR